MNLSPAWVEVLREAGHDAVHWSAVGRPGASDRELMDWARRGGFVVLTSDLDLGAILAVTRAEGPSVLQIRAQAVSPERLRDALFAALGRFETELRAGAVVTLDTARARVRILPLQSKNGT